MNIIQSIKYGDEFVFQQVFYEYHERLYFYFLGKTKSTYLAEETVQITFIKFWNYRESLNEELSVYTQLFRIASTTLIDLLRKKYTASTLVSELLKLETEPSANVVEHNIDVRDTERMLYKVLQSMPPMRRKAFELSRFEGKSYNEISSELSISPKTVENHIALAIKFLRKHISNLLLLVYLNGSLFFSVLGVLVFLNVLIYCYHFCD